MPSKKIDSQLMLLDYIVSAQKAGISMEKAVGAWTEGVAVEDIPRSESEKVTVEDLKISQNTIHPAEARGSKKYRDLAVKIYKLESEREEIELAPGKDVLSIKTRREVIGKIDVAIMKLRKAQASIRFEKTGAIDRHGKKERGRPLGPLSEAIKFVFLECTEKDLAIIRSDDIHHFMYLLKNAADEEHPAFSSYVEERIKSIKRQGQVWRIITQERHTQLSQGKVKVDPSREYSHNNVKTRLKKYIE